MIKVKELLEQFGLVEEEYYYIHKLDFFDIRSDAQIERYFQPLKIPKDFLYVRAKLIMNPVFYGKKRYSLVQFEDVQFLDNQMRVIDQKITSVKLEELIDQYCSLFYVDLKDPVSEILSSIIADAHSLNWTPKPDIESDYSIFLKRKEGIECIKEVIKNKETRLI